MVVLSNTLLAIILEPKEKESQVQSAITTTEEPRMFATMTHSLELGTFDILFFNSDPQGVDSSHPYGSGPPSIRHEAASVSFPSTMHSTSGSNNFPDESLHGGFDCCHTFHLLSDGHSS